MRNKIDVQITYECIDKDELLQRIEEKTNFILVDTIGTYAGNKYRIKGAKTIPFPDVKVYEGGIDEWTAHNLPVEEYE
jgi:3-mercaptopyruvate sulfurtransferase SseA